MWGKYNLAKAYRSIKNPLPIAESRTGKPAMVTLKIQLDCSTVHDTKLWVNKFVRTHLGCGTDSVFICLCRSHKYFKDAKAMQTRTTRTPAFCGYPPPPHDYPYYWPVHFEFQVHTIDQFISDPKSKQGESWKIRKICAKIQNFRILS